LILERIFPKKIKRFVLSCNDSTKLIDAIQSRCAILRFTKLTDKQILARLLEIIKKEDVIEVIIGKILTF